MTPPKRAWKGAGALEAWLVEIDSLEPFPDNPRKGDVEVVARSLARFGQVRSVLTDGGARIVAGHHVVEAARTLGWTHVAAMPNEFESEEEARAYLLADNRTAELGGYDKDLLAVQLSALSDFDGTGWTADDHRDLQAELAHLHDPQFPESDEVPALDARSQTSGLFEVPLLLDREARGDFARLVGVLRREWAVEDTTSVVVRAVREAAERT